MKGYEINRIATRAIKNGLRYLATQWSEQQYAYLEGMITMAHVTEVITTEQFDSFDDKLHNIREERPED